jgi:uncharacterized protein YjbI with pentapeptide repeats
MPTQEVIDLVNRIRRGEVNIFTELEGANLEGADLSGIKLAGAVLNRVNLEGANLSNIDFEDVLLNNANLKGANLEDAKLSSCELVHVDLENAKLIGTDFISCYLDFANLKYVDARDSFFTNVEMQGSDFNNAILVGSEFTAEDQSERVNLSNTTFINANLERVIFYTVNLNGSNLTGANLQKAYMYDTYLMNAILNGVNMSHMYFDSNSINTRGTDLTNVIGMNLVFDNDEDYNDFMHVVMNQNQEIGNIEQANRFVQEMHDEYYNEVVQNNRPTIHKYRGQVNLNSEIVDIYDLTYDDNGNKIDGLNNINGFLNHDPNNIVFIYQNNLFFSNKNYISKTLYDANFIKFACINADGTMNPQNIIIHKPYITLKQIGLYGGLITMTQGFEVFFGNNRVFYVSQTNQTLASTVTLSVLNGGNRVSASHCQEGQGDIVYNLEYIDLPTTSTEVKGGKKKKNKSNKERKSKRVTRKNKSKKHKISRKNKFI